MIREEPFVNGISMSELKQLFDTSFKHEESIMLLILDCCYSGNIAKGDSPREEYERLVNDNFGGDRRIIITSSTSGKGSREASCKHEDGKPAHTHGIFTYCLLEGLDRASNDNGVITLDKLKVFVKGKMRSMEKQEPTFFPAESHKFGDTTIAISPKKRKEIIDEKTDEFYNNFNPTDMESLHIAATKVTELMELKASNLLVEILKTDTINALKNYKGKMSQWLQNNSRTFRPEITRKKNNERNIYRKQLLEKLERQYPGLYTLEKHLDFENFSKLANPRLCFFITICDYINDSSEIDNFIDRCVTCLMTPAVSESPNSLGVSI